MGVVDEQFNNTLNFGVWVGLAVMSLSFLGQDIFL